VLWETAYVGIHSYLLIIKAIEYAYGNLFYINEDLVFYKYGYYFMLADILYNCIVSHIVED
jgi:hypothetical protein